ncbi:ABC transporter permease [Streptomonospora nanhaiensis]|uniref:Peptide/nickel transport system permease protein n=1 Tax=Streptomonospora nanhaiensis TaxID=1323731 RepID=A0A853BTS7_9ACTN|nr:ABC transporter permease [Streptomonospora nanhaiensis]MBV2365831.1 ABC transporter permease [Streptomonospora nanhaiensis]MBX9390337.1 ABC transporter permease [Streptomonospora nanhaiensis]NYI98135.1 peptide/nickel transport system permease protein [Streptomonospora nanhaiensis]
MSRLILYRLGYGLLTLFVVSLVVFLATQALPGDAARAILGRDATAERVALLRDQLNLDDPLAVQYGKWLAGLFTLDLGDSFANARPVSEYLGPRVTASFVLMGLAALIATPVSLLIGAYSALRRDRAADHATSAVSLVLAALPEFAVGILLILLLSTGWLHLLPPVFAGSAGAVLADPAQLILPVLTLVLAVSPPIIRMMRASMIEVLESEYVQQARLKGLPERVVVWRHAAPNAIGPVAQVIAVQLGWLAGGVVAIEFLFAFPGIGLALMDAITTRDIPVIQAVTLLIAVVYIVVNLLADVVGLAANPKVRVSAR